MVSVVAYVSFQALAEYNAAPLYLKNYQKAVTTIHRCWQENVQFATLTKVSQLITQ